MEPAQWLGGNRWRAYAALALFVLAGIPLHLGMKQASWADNPNLLPLNARAPLLQGPNLAGVYYDSTTDRGLVRVFVFLDPTRAAGTKQGRAIKAWRETYRDGRVRFITVLTAGSEAGRRAFVEKFGLDPALTVFDRGATRAPQFRVAQTPVVYIIDGANRVRFAADKVVRADNKRFLQIIDDYLPPEGGRAQRRAQ